jgi:hypothetical protein
MSSVFIGGRRYSTQLWSRDRGLTLKIDFCYTWSTLTALRNGLRLPIIYQEGLESNAEKDGTTI